MVTDADDDQRQSSEPRCGESPVGVTAESCGSPEASAKGNHAPTPLPRAAEAAPAQWRHFPRWSRCPSCGSGEWERAYRSTSGSNETRRCRCGYLYVVLPLTEKPGADGCSRWILPG